jgi:hypothetical protein
MISALPILPATRVTNAWPMLWSKINSTGTREIRRGQHGGERLLLSAAGMFRRRDTEVYVIARSSARTTRRASAHCRRSPFCEFDEASYPTPHDSRRSREGTA